MSWKASALFQNIFVNCVISLHMLSEWVLQGVVHLPCTTTAVQSSLNYKVNPQNVFYNLSKWQKNCILQPVERREKLDLFPIFATQNWQKITVHRDH